VRKEKKNRREEKNKRREGQHVTTLFTKKLHIGTKNRSPMKERGEEENVQKKEGRTKQMSVQPFGNPAECHRVQNSEEKKGDYEGKKGVKRV